MAAGKDGSWDEYEVADAVYFLAANIALSEPNAGERVEAAHELVVFYEAGELDVGRGLDLMNTIVPGLHVDERGQAAVVLARLSVDTDWDDTDRMEGMSEVFRLVTGVPLDAEERIGATVDLARLGARSSTRARVRRRGRGHGDPHYQGSHDREPH